MTLQCAPLRRPPAAGPVSGPHAHQPAQPVHPVLRLAALALGPVPHSREQHAVRRRAASAEQPARGVQPRHKLRQQDQEPLPGSAGHLQSLPGNPPHVPGEKTYHMCNVQVPGYRQRRAVLGLYRWVIFQPSFFFMMRFPEGTAER